MDKDAQLIQLLNDLSWPVSPQVFQALCQTFTTCGVDLAVTRANPSTGQGEILLIQRPDTDPIYPGQYHVPGSLFRGHEPIESVIGRILADELAGTQLNSPVRIQGNYFRNTRGPDVMLLYATRLTGNYTGPGEWFGFEDVPDNMIADQKVIPAQAQVWWDN